MYLHPSSPPRPILSPRTHPFTMLADMYYRNSGKRTPAPNLQQNYSATPLSTGTRNEREHSPMETTVASEVPPVLETKGNTKENDRSRESLTTSEYDNPYNELNNRVVKINHIPESTPVAQEKSCKILSYSNKRSQAVAALVREYLAETTSDKEVQNTDIDDDFLTQRKTFFLSTIFKNSDDDSYFGTRFCASDVTLDRKLNYENALNNIRNLKF